MASEAQRICFFRVDRKVVFGVLRIQKPEDLRAMGIVAASALAVIRRRMNCQVVSHLSAYIRYRPRRRVDSVGMTGAAKSARVFF